MVAGTICRNGRPDGGCTGARVVIVGASGEEALGEAIAGDMRHRSVVLSGRTSIRELMAVMKRCRLFVTNDTGPMHIASAFGVPSSPSSDRRIPERRRPSGQTHTHREAGGRVFPVHAQGMSDRSSMHDAGHRRTRLSGSITTTERYEPPVSYRHSVVRVTLSTQHSALDFTLGWRDRLSRSRWDRESRHRIYQVARRTRVASRRRGGDRATESGRSPCRTGDESVGYCARFHVNRSAEDYSRRAHGSPRGGRCAIRCPVLLSASSR